MPPQYQYPDLATTTTTTTTPDATTGAESSSGVPVPSMVMIGPDLNESRTP
jgi:hypothetical protein